MRASRFLGAALVFWIAGLSSSSASVECSKNATCAFKNDSDVKAGSEKRVATACFVQAGTQYGIDPLLLYAIAEVESRLNPAAKNRNRDGSIDYGLMQINSQHLPRLERRGINAVRLLAEPCLSVHTGAEILAELIGRHGYTWTAVGAYNAGSGPSREQARQRYASKVWQRYSRLIAARSAPIAQQKVPSVSAKTPTPPSPAVVARRNAAPVNKRQVPKGFFWGADEHSLAGLQKLPAVPRQ